MKSSYSFGKPWWNFHNFQSFYYFPNSNNFHRFHNFCNFHNFIPLQAFWAWIEIELHTLRISSLTLIRVSKTIFPKKITQSNSPPFLQSPQGTQQWRSHKLNQFSNLAIGRYLGIIPGWLLWMLIMLSSSNKLLKKWPNYQKLLEYFQKSNFLKTWEI